MNDDEEEQVTSLGCQHTTMDEFQQTVIHDIIEQHNASKYPLDGRNLEQGFVKQKKRKLAKSLHTHKRSEFVDSHPHERSECVEQSDSQTEMSLGVYRGDIVDSSHVATGVVPFTCKFAIWSKLFPFQQTGVNFLLEKYLNNTGGLLADEMGLGKSVQIVAFVVAIFGNNKHLVNPVLLICPTTLISHWMNEFEKWDPEIRVREYTGNAGIEKNSVYLISYEQFRARGGSKVVWSAVVLDEAQRIRNPHAKITLCVKNTNSQCRIALSGSPIQNNLTELWSIVDFVSPGMLGSLVAFQEELAAPIEEGTKSRATNYQIQMSYKCAVLLRDLTRPLMLRRLKADYSTEITLTEKQEEVLFCKLTWEQIEVYTQFLSTESVRKCVQNFNQKKRHNYANTQNGPAKGGNFYCLSILRRISNHPDLLLSNPSDVCDYGSPSRSGKLLVLSNLLKIWQKSGLKSLIFSQSLGVLDILEILLSSLKISYSRMDGSTPQNQRGGIVDQFSTKNGPMCLLLSTRVGGVGLNLIAATRVVIFDPDWNPMTDAQARERSWRIGQTENVKIYRLVAAETIEEIICKRQIYKHYLASKILVDPRQGHVHEWDYGIDMFKAPTTSSRPHRRHDESLKKICSLFDSEQVVLTNEESNSLESNAPPSSLITKVWNQEEIEMPFLSSSLVDLSEVDAAANRALQAVLHSTSSATSRTTASSSTKHLPGSISRSASLLSKLAANSAQPTITVRYDTLVLEKRYITQIQNFFKNGQEFSTSEILDNFKIPSDHADVFRACLRQICVMHNGKWTTRR